MSSWGPSEGRVKRRALLTRCVDAIRQNGLLVERSRNELVKAVHGEKVLDGGCLDRPRRRAFRGEPTGDVRSDRVESEETHEASRGEAKAGCADALERLLKQSVRKRGEFSSSWWWSRSRCVDSQRGYNESEGGAQTERRRASERDEPWAELQERWCWQGRSERAGGRVSEAQRRRASGEEDGRGGRGGKGREGVNGVAAAEPLIAFVLGTARSE